MATPKVSIVIPALNEEKFLSDCLQSLRNQDYSGEYEIIVVDNGSSDNTAKIARDFGAKVICYTDKRGAPYARQVGAETAYGDIIAQADADTIYPRDWLKRIARLASEPRAVAIAGRFIYKDSFIWAEIEILLRHCINRLAVALIGRPLVISGAAFAFCRKDFLSVNGYRGLSFSADQYSICSRLSKRGKILYDKDLLCLTSTRSVQKPTFILIMANVVNLSRWVMYLIKSRVSEVRLFIKRALYNRVAGLSPVRIVSMFPVCGYFMPTSCLFGKVYYKGESMENAVALTFDDGPNQPYTSRILDILASHNIKVTFFVIGKNVELYSETVKRIGDEGHVVGNHSYTHNANYFLFQNGSKDVQLAQEAIFNAIGVKPHLYRPPHGRKTPWHLQAVQKEGLITVTWSVSVNEQHALAFFGKPSAKTFAQKVVRKTSPGKIILLHDGYGTRHNCAKSDKSLVIKALPLIIKGLQDKGYRLVTVPELLNVPAYNEASIQI